MKSSCQWHLKKLWAYLSDELNEKDTLRMEEHLQTCGNCRTELGRRKDALELLANDGASIMETMAETVLTAQEVTHEEEPTPAKPKNKLKLAPMLTAVCLLAGGFLVWKELLKPLDDKKVVLTNSAANKPAAEPAKIVEKPKNIVTVDNTDVKPVETQPEAKPDDKSANQTPAAVNQQPDNKQSKPVEPKVKKKPVSKSKTYKPKPKSKSRSTAPPPKQPGVVVYSPNGEIIGKSDGN